jgi:hypothetical protein
MHPEDLAELAPGAEEELDLALVEAQRLGQPRQPDPRRRRQGGQLGGVDRAGGRVGGISGRCYTDRCTAM